MKIAIEKEKNNFVFSLEFDERDKYVMPFDNIFEFKRFVMSNVENVLDKELSKVLLNDYKIN